MTTFDQPLVTVLTPVYNGADFIAECIESVLKQTYRNFEYIIVNNCSKDRTLEIAQSYAAKDPRIRVHDNTDFLGVIANHNLAFSLMSPASKYCKVVSGDDFIFPECLERMVALAEAHPTVGLVGSYSIAGKNLTCIGLEYERQAVNGREVSAASLLGGPYVFGAPTSLLYRADLVRKTPAFYPNASPHADTSGCYEALQHSDFGFVHQVLSYTRIHSETQTSRSLKFGTIFRATLSDLVKYGPVYLSKAALERRLSFFIDRYYEWMVTASLSEWRNREFWHAQTAGLEEIGLKFSYGRLVKAVFAKALRSLSKPIATAQRLFAVKSRGADQIEAQYYQ